MSSKSNLRKNLFRCVSIASHEKKWVMLESSFMNKLEKAIDEKNLQEAKNYEARCSRIQRREIRFQHKLKEKFEEIRQEDARLYGALKPVEDKIEIYQRIISVKIEKPYFGQQGTIPTELSKDKIDWEKLKREVTKANKQGVLPLLNLLTYVVKKIKNFAEESFKYDHMLTPFSYNDNIRVYCPQESTKEINRYFFQVFKRTASPSLTMAQRSQKKVYGEFIRKDDVPMIEHYKVFAGYMHDKIRGMDVLALATLFNEGFHTIHPGNVVEDVRRLLKGKRILSLGDDTGSFTEVLQHFGCKTLGIEFDSGKVKLAHEGYLSEDRKPRTDVIQGDIWDLLIPGSKLLKTVGKYKYDAIFSKSLFNSGSGGEMPNRKLEKELKVMYEDKFRKDFSGRRTDLPPRLSGEGGFFGLFIDITRSLLKKNGVQVHLGTDLGWDVPKTLRWKWGVINRPRHKLAYDFK